MNVTTSYQQLFPVPALPIDVREVENQHGNPTFKQLGIIAGPAGQTAYYTVTGRPKGQANAVTADYLAGVIQLVEYDEITACDGAHFCLVVRSNHG